MSSDTIELELAHDDLQQLLDEMEQYQDLYKDNELYFTFQLLKDKLKRFLPDIKNLKKSKDKFLHDKSQYNNLKDDLHQAESEISRLLKKVDDLENPISNCVNSLKIFNKKNSIAN